MRPLSLSRDHARRFLARRHLLDAPRSLRSEPASVLAVVERLGSLQFDPLDAPGARNHDLVLHARIDGYSPAFTDALLYAPPGERRLFEAYNKSLNILPLHELPYYRLTWETARARYAPTIFAERAPARRTILARIRREGPLATAAFAAQFGAPIPCHWGPTAEGRAVLEALFESGEVAIARRDGSRRTYDLTARLFPAEVLKRRVPREEAMRHRLLSRYRGMGLMAAVGGGEITLRTGTPAERKALLAGLVADGTLVPVEVEGVKGTRCVLAEELAVVEATARPEPDRPRGVAFVAPLDPLLWDRKLLSSLFAFDYRWEVYTPEAKRRFGYYVLPILFGDRFVGRIEPRLDRERGTLQIVGVVFEAGFLPLEEPGFVPALAEALSAYQGFVGAERVGWPRTRAARALRTAVEACQARAGAPPRIDVTAT